MPKADFDQNFLNPNNDPKVVGSSRYTNCPVARLLFEVLNRDENIITMIDACERGKPALEPMAQTIQKTLTPIQAGLAGCSLPASSDWLNPVGSQAGPTIGKMAAVILAPFGWIWKPKSDVKIPSAAPWLETAGLYEYDETKAVMRVVKRIECVGKRVEDGTP